MKYTIKTNQKTPLTKQEIELMMNTGVNIYFDVYEEYKDDELYSKEWNINDFFVEGVTLDEMLEIGEFYNV